jgi:tetratricopeptide (TPR) repeat protein
MHIEATLLTKDTETIQGLQEGTLIRHGSIIKDRHKERNISFLIEAPGFTEQLMSLASPPLLGGALVNDTYNSSILNNQLASINPQFNGIEKTLSSVLQISQIAAGASILNLGISIAGFAYMGYKLNQIQSSLGRIQKSIEAGFADIEDRLGTISGQLSYLHLLVLDNSRKQQSLAQAISNLQRTIFLKEISDLAAEILNFNRFPSHSSREGIIKVASGLRLFLSNQIIQISPEDDIEILFNNDLSIQGWALATAIEANLMLEMGNIKEAKELLELEINSFKELVVKWSDKLLDDTNSQLATAYRFTAPCFQKHISLERIERIINISERDISLSPEQIRRKKYEIEVEYQMSDSNICDKYWQYRQIAIAEFLDALTELYARLDSLRYFAELCLTKNVKSSKEILVDKTTEQGLYIIKSQND